MYTAPFSSKYARPLCKWWAKTGSLVLSPLPGKTPDQDLYTGIVYPPLECRLSIESFGLEGAVLDASRSTWWSKDSWGIVPEGGHRERQRVFVADIPGCWEMKVALCSHDPQIFYGNYGQGERQHFAGRQAASNVHVLALFSWRAWKRRLEELRNKWNNNWVVGRSLEVWFVLQSELGAGAVQKTQAWPPQQLPVHSSCWSKR